MIVTHSTISMRPSLNTVSRTSMKETYTTSDQGMTTASVDFTYQILKTLQVYADEVPKKLSAF